MSKSDTRLMTELFIRFKTVKCSDSYADKSHHVTGSKNR